MVPPPSTPAPRLSYLVGPGPRATRPISTLRVGLSNLDESVRALRLRLAVFRCDGSGRPLVQAQWGGTLPRRSNRELDGAIDWVKGELRLEGRSVTFEPDREAPAESLHVVRAQLLDGATTVGEVLEVGLRSGADRASRP